MSLCLFFQVSDLKENKKYQFQVRAANMAGVGIPSLPSNTFLCEEWTIAVPGWLGHMFHQLREYFNEPFDEQKQTKKKPSNAHCFIFLSPMLHINTTISEKYGK